MKKDKEGHLHFYFQFTKDQRDVMTNFEGLLKYILPIWCQYPVKISSHSHWWKYCSVELVVSRREEAVFMSAFGHILEIVKRCLIEKGRPMKATPSTQDIVPYKGDALDKIQAVFQIYALLSSIHTDASGMISDFQISVQSAERMELIFKEKDNDRLVLVKKEGEWYIEVPQKDKLIWVPIECCYVHQQYTMIKELTL